MLGGASEPHHPITHFLFHLPRSCSLARAGSARVGSTRVSTPWRRQPSRSWPPAVMWPDMAARPNTPALNHTMRLWSSQIFSWEIGEPSKDWLSESEQRGDYTKSSKSQTTSLENPIRLPDSQGSQSHCCGLHTQEAWLCSCVACLLPGIFYLLCFLLLCHFLSFSARGSWSRCFEDCRGSQTESCGQQSKVSWATAQSS